MPRKFVFKDALEYLERLSRFGIRMGLENIRKLLEILGNPEKNFKTVHIGGTVGKGSTAHLVASILTQQGFCTGLFTSPHIYDVRERFRIDGRMIGKMEFAQLVREIREKIEGFRDFHPTQFEFHTALAFTWFARQGCEIAVIEVGLGGRLDATNVIVPEIAIITDVGIDHTDILGTTIKEIAKEKAGIIKQGVPVLTSAEGEALSVLKEECRIRGTQIYPLGEVISIESNDKLSVKSPWGKVEGIKTSLKGEHQLRNIALAASAGLFLGCSEKAIKEGIRKTRIKGRFEIIRRNPYVVIDGAHNPPAMKVLRRSIEEYFPNKRLILVIGMLKDKPVEESFREIVPFADCVIVTPPPSERSSPLEMLYLIAKNFNQNVIKIEDNREAVRKAIQMANKEDIIVITGSFYLLGALPDIRKLVSEKFRKDI
ncbi:bifunctional folylpolyglutamate synthase/dihydrofolate synthase [bacterium]|nr:bifunctional folylpolyglutamate synthase/dihydrofolate synthase [bacterium]